MNDLKIDTKLLKVLDLLHLAKLKLLDEEDITYAELHKIYNKVELVYDTIQQQKSRPESFRVNGQLININNKQVGDTSE
jgi:hypothetical protein